MYSIVLGPKTGFSQRLSFRTAASASTLARWKLKATLKTRKPQKMAGARPKSQLRQSVVQQKKSGAKAKASEVPKSSDRIGLFCERTKAPAKSRTFPARMERNRGSVSLPVPKAKTTRKTLHKSSAKSKSKAFLVSLWTKTSFTRNISIFIYYTILTGIWVQNKKRAADAARFKNKVIFETFTLRWQA